MKISRTAPAAIALLAVLTLGIASLGLFVASQAWGAQEGATVVVDADIVRWAFISAALSTALAALAAGYAVARVGSAAVGALAEKPELFGRALVLVGLAEGIAIYGLIVSILILNRVG
ncbi:MAG TPA: ATP synthase subunit C [Steroidobacteraceae bacterium]|nr:ATP synthase subunit C [Steroidobacteraceae bacterium]